MPISNVRIVRDEVIGDTQYTHIIIDLTCDSDSSNDERSSCGTTLTQSTQTQADDATANDASPQATNNHVPSDEARVYKSTTCQPSSAQKN
jgi:hypothetical protein